MPLWPDQQLFGYLTMDLAIKIDHLSFGYDHKYFVIADLSLQVAAQEVLAVIGPNGAGKTTLFMLMCGILTPNSGSVFLYDQKVIPKKFNPGINYVFQNPDDQLFFPTVSEDVAFGPQNLNWPEHKIRQQTAYALAATGITQLADKSPHHLSDGQKRMAAIAAVIAMDPKIVIYDEPTSSLDSQGQKRVKELIQASDKTQVICSHDLEFLLEVSTKVCLMDQGKIVAHGRPTEIMANASLMDKHGLDVPPSLRKR